MRASNLHISTLKETPADADIASHQLMLRAGLINRLSSGLYTWMPLGLKVLRKVEALVREEMNRAGAVEILMPTVQPAELWEESGRWAEFGPQLLKMTDRHERRFCFGPTHEEVITDYARKTLKSYKQLPINFYQIQTKFRDEIRPRFGIMRAREFTMKDAYSFHVDEASLKETFLAMHKAYSTIFTRLGLHFRAVEADSGAIGGSGSIEFHVLADSGEDALVCSSESDYAANIEKAEAVCLDEQAAPGAELALIDTPETKTIQALVSNFDIPIEKTIKTLIVKAAEDSESDYIALLIRGDHELNEVKAENLPDVAQPLQFAEENEIRQIIGAGPGSLGPVNLPIPCIADRSVAALANFGAGANIEDKHYFNINWDRDTPLPIVHDLRNVNAGDPSPDGKGILNIIRGIEVGHIFQLGDKYSIAMNANVLDQSGKPTPMAMGCYGIGVSRIVAAAIEQNHDEKGIIWPSAMAPFQMVLAPINLHKSTRLREAATQLYDDLLNAGIDVLFDDRPVRPGFMFADHELLGIPHRLIISEKGLDRNMLEYKGRRDTDSTDIPLNEAIPLMKQKILT